MIRSMRTRLRAVELLDDRLERRVHALDGVADRIGELGVHQQELRDPVGLQIRREHAAVRLERRAAGEQRHPVEIVGLGRDREVGVEQHRDRAGPLGELAELHEPPALAVAHRRFGRAVEGVGAFADQRHQAHDRGGVLRVHFGLDDLVEQPVQLLPHLGADLLAHLRGVLARRRDARHDRGAVLPIGGEASDRDLRILVARIGRQPEARRAPGTSAGRARHSPRLSIRLCVASIARAQLSARSK